MMRATTAVGLLTAAHGAFAQPVFDVASIKQSQIGKTERGGETTSLSPESLRRTEFAIARSCDGHELKPYQVAGPG